MVTVGNCAITFSTIAATEMTKRKVPRSVRVLPRNFPKQRMCTAACSLQCPPNAHLAPHAEEYVRGRPQKLSKSSAVLRDSPFVLNLRLTRTSTAGGFFDYGVGGGSSVV